jgi:ribosome modulation factor
VPGQSTRLQNDPRSRHCGHGFTAGYEGKPESTFPNDRRNTMSLWLLILIIVLAALALGGFGYSRF